MKAFNLRRLHNQVIACLQAHPVETLLGIAFFMLHIFAQQLEYNPSVAWKDSPQAMWEYIQAFFPVLFVVSFCANATFRGKWRVLYYVTFLLIIPLYLLREQLGAFCDSTAYPCTLLLTACLLVGYRRTDGNASFARNLIKLVTDVGFSFLIGILLMLTINAIYYSVVYIFDLKEWRSFTLHTTMAMLFLVIPLLFCYFTQEKQTDTDDSKPLPPAIVIILYFILSPGVIIYTSILYLYSLIILFRWELPKGGIAYMVMAFILCTLAGRLSQFIVKERHYDWFYRPFSFIAIPPLLLFWVGTIHRISEYSLTEARVYLLAAGILMTLYVFFLRSKRLGSYRLMLLISAFVIAVLTYIPGISAKSIGIASQEHRLEALARSLSLWNDSTARLTATRSFHSTDTLMLRQAIQLIDSYDYLEKVQGKELAVARYGKNELKRPELLPYARKKEEPTYRRYTLPTKAHLSIEAYRHYYPSCLTEVKNDTLFVYVSGRQEPILQQDVKAHFAPYEKTIAAWKDDATDIAPFCVENDSCLVVLDGFTREADGDYLTFVYAVAFTK
jgi:hypothetical protein